MSTFINVNVDLQGILNRLKDQQQAQRRAQLEKVKNDDFEQQIADAVEQYQQQQQLRSFTGPASTAPPSTKVRQDDLAAFRRGDACDLLRPTSGGAGDIEFKVIGYVSPDPDCSIDARWYVPPFDVYYEETNNSCTFLESVQASVPRDVPYAFPTPTAGWSDWVYVGRRSAFQVTSLVRGYNVNPPNDPTQPNPGTGLTGNCGWHSMSLGVTRDINFLGQNPNIESIGVVLAVASSNTSIFSRYFARFTVPTLMELRTSQIAGSGDGPPCNVRVNARCLGQPWFPWDGPPL